MEAQISQTNPVHVFVVDDVDGAFNIPGYFNQRITAFFSP